MDPLYWVRNGDIDETFVPANNPEGAIIKALLMTFLKNGIPKLTTLTAVTDIETNRREDIRFPKEVVNSPKKMKKVFEALMDFAGKGDFPAPPPKIQRFPPPKPPPPAKVDKALADAMLYIRRGALPRRRV